MVSLTEIDRMIRNNRKKMSAIRELNLPIGEYAITGSGALGIRYLREINDIDIIVTLGLWNTLVKKYGMTNENDVNKVVFPGEVVEAFCGDISFYADKKDVNAPSLAERIEKAEMIDGLPFESLEHVLYYKRKMSREKDLKDISIISKIMSEKPPFEIRAFVDDIQRIKKLLALHQASYNREYEFRDEIYYPDDRELDLNREFIRLRVYQKTGWDQKNVELAYKVKYSTHISGTCLFKKQFDFFTESQVFLNQHKHAFSFSRRGLEYELDGARIFVEDIEGLSPSVEIVSSSKQKMDHIFEMMAPVQITSDSVPKLVEKLHKKGIY